MPELPEVETVRRSLAAALTGRTIVSTRLHRADVVHGPRRSGDLLRGGRIAQVQRTGKQLAIIADDGRALCVHLGMSGQLLTLPAGARPARGDHIHISWRLDDQDGAAARLLFRDPRRFGGVWTFTSLETLTRERWSDLGPDALSLTPDLLASRLAGTNRPLKPALLDQSVVAGLGNIYVDEALHLARHAPHRPASSADPERLCEAILSTLHRAIEAGGSSLRDYVDARGEPGWFQLSHAVYGRAGEPCRSCGRPLKSGQFAQRTTVWCESCQQ